MEVPTTPIVCFIKVNSVNFYINCVDNLLK